MRRRDFITLLGGAAAAWPLAARAQEGAAVKRLGILIGGTEAQFGAQNTELVQALAQLGWTEGRNLRIDFRIVGSNDPDLIRPHAEALLTHRRQGREHDNSYRFCEWQRYGSASLASLIPVRWS